MSVVNVINFSTPFLIGVPNSRISPEWIRLLGMLITSASVAPTTSDEFQDFFSTSRYPAALSVNNNNGSQDPLEAIRSMRAMAHDLTARINELEGQLLISRARTSSSANSVAVLDDNASNLTVYPLWANGSSAQRAVSASSTKWTFNPSTGRMSVTGALVAQSGTAIPAGGTAGSGFMFSSTANFGITFGSGAPTHSAAKGSLYLRSDGSTTNDRAYINTNGTTTWTSLITAA